MNIFKSIFYFTNILLFIFYLYPGSLLGCIVNNDCDTQPQLTRDIIISSNHFFAFFFLSIYGFFLYSKKLKEIGFYLVFISLLLEFLHLIIPYREFSFSDIFGNLFGIFLSFLIVKLFIQLKNINT
tara:strand:- start:608 stop:985 length:378 start_codon:yes stop_codon:yes gene_type:complete